MIIRGTLGAKNTVVLKEAQGGMRRLRCPKCNALAVPIQNSFGQEIFQCGGCGGQFRAQSM